MIIFKCRFTNDEMISDAYKTFPVKDSEGNEVPGLFAVQSQKVNKDSGAKIDIGCGSEFGGSEPDEGVDDTVELVNNVVDETFGFGLQEVPLAKKDLKDYLQDYCQKVRQKLKDDDKVPGPEVKAFTQAAPIFCKYLLTKFDDMQFYTSRSMDPEGSMSFAMYADGAVDPMFIYIKAGLWEEKC